MKPVHKSLITIGIIAFGLLLLSMNSYSQSAKDVKPKLFSAIQGSWTSQKVYDMKKDITPTDAKELQQLRFDMEGHYVISSPSTPMIDSGSYRMNENSALLYLESQIDYPKGDQRANQATWLVSVNGDILTMTGKGSARAERLRQVYVRTKSINADAGNN